MSSKAQKSSKKSLLRNGKNTECHKSIHSNLGFIIGLVSIIIIFYIGFPYIFEVEEFDRNNGIFAIFESAFLFIGLFFTDIIRGEGTIFKKKLKEDHINSLIFAIFLFFLLGLIHGLFDRFNLIISNTEIDILIILSAPAEELFFRGFIISIFLSINKIIEPKSKFLKNGYSSILPVIGIIISSIFFARLHVFQYDNISFLFAVFIVGIILGVYYWFTQDLTTCILAHLFNNITAQYGYYVGIISIVFVSIYYSIIHFKRFIKNFPDLNVLEKSLL